MGYTFSSIRSEVQPSSLTVLLYNRLEPRLVDRNDAALQVIKREFDDKRQGAPVI